MSGQWILSYLSLKCHHLSIVWILNVVAKYLSLLWERFLHACLFHLQSFVKHSQSEITKKYNSSASLGMSVGKPLSWVNSVNQVMLQSLFPLIDIPSFRCTLSVVITIDKLSFVIQSNSCPSTLLSAGWWLSFWHCGRTIPIIVGLRTTKVKKVLLKKIWKTTDKNAC